MGDVYILSPVRSTISTTISDSSQYVNIAPDKVLSFVALISLECNEFHQQGNAACCKTRNARGDLRIIGVIFKSGDSIRIHLLSTGGYICRSETTVSCYQTIISQCTEKRGRAWYQIPHTMC